MNREQYKVYRRNQRACYDYDYGYPNDSEYWSRVPLSHPGRRYVPVDDKKNLVYWLGVFKYSQVNERLRRRSIDIVRDVIRQNMQP